MSVLHHIVIAVAYSLLAALGHAPDLLAYDRRHAFAAHWLVKIVIVGVVFLSLWSAAHRLRITSYDLGVRADTLVATIVYAVAVAASVAAAAYLLLI